MNCCRLASKHSPETFSSAADRLHDGPGCPSSFPGALSTSPRLCGCCPCAPSSEAKNTPVANAAVRREHFFLPTKIPPRGLCYRPASASTCCLGLTGHETETGRGPGRTRFCPGQSPPQGQAGCSAVLSAGPPLGSAPNWHQLASILIPLFRGSPDLAVSTCSLAFELCCSSSAWCCG